MGRRLDAKRDTRNEIKGHTACIEQKNDGCNDKSYNANGMNHGTSDSSKMRKRDLRWTMRKAVWTSSKHKSNKGKQKARRGAGINFLDERGTTSFGTGLVGNFRQKCIKWAHDHNDFF